MGDPCPTPSPHNRVEGSDQAAGGTNPRDLVGRFLTFPPQPLPETERMLPGTSQVDVRFAVRDHDQLRIPEAIAELGY